MVFIEVNEILIRADLVKVAYPSAMRGVTIIKFTDNTKSEFEMEYKEFIKAFKKAFSNGVFYEDLK